MLYIVATPIGNLEDMTFRAVRVLKEVDLILAEDTRHSGILLKHYEIKTRMSSFHTHTTQAKVEHFVRELKGVDGEAPKDMALITDAGTPGISDPAYVLVNAAIKAGIEVVPIPGPSAFLTALSASGAMTNRFVYLGFLPIKKGRQTLFTALQEEEKTIVFYEAPQRILKTLREIEKYLGERELVIGRELTKKFEEFVRGETSEVITHFEEKKPKGEFVVIINGKK
ncbi:16S rRNA (cytidine(1402)-2'-O)-methyltransferase [Candidatus Peregrinibacteria bacterium]|jgi:16S rRNA (cytidine1402-2'-O)-methyltransferase|nr:16S rRNA (cytidine(1402)-2'-O)-methyltransferase [Candidatus Peregrinibacteria bacterium]